MVQALGYEDERKYDDMVCMSVKFVNFGSFSDHFYSITICCEPAVYFLRK